MSRTRVARMAVFGVALASGGAAFWIANSKSPPPPPPPPPPPIATEHVLIVTRDLAYGAALRDGDTDWVEWPKASVPNGVVRKSESPNVKDEIKGRFVRVPIANGEPLRRERLIEAPTTKLMSTVLSPGRRAVAVDISAQAANAAGGFILPNDHVDVIRTFRGQVRGNEIVGSETIAKNVRVLAMGQTVETKGVEPVITSVTATLELDPRQTELVVLGQRTGQLTLSLLAMADWSSDDESLQPVPASGPLFGAFGVLGGRLTMPKETGNADKSEAGIHQKHNFSPRQVLNAN